jgi:hypothetical protein
MLSRPVLSFLAGNGFDVAADGLDDFPRYHVAVGAPGEVLYLISDNDEP